MTVFWTILAILIIVVAGYYLFFAGGSPLSSPSPSPFLSSPSPTISPTLSPSPTGGATRFDMGEQSDSNQTGTVTFTPSGTTRTKVTIELDNVPVGAVEPAHIHSGSCETPGTIRYTLSSVVNGRSETTINATIDQLRNLEPAVVNVHRSAAQSNIYVSCSQLDF